MNNDAKNNNTRILPIPSSEYPKLSVTSLLFFIVFLCLRLENEKLSDRMKTKKNEVL